MKKKHTFSFVFLFIFLLFCLFLIQILQRGKPNIILISIDTLRADHLGCYGYERNTSPNIDNFASQSIVFEKVFSQSSATAPSHVSMLTSLYPLSTDILRNDEPFMFSEDIKMLQQVLKEANFNTAAFTGGGYVSKAQGFSRGFDTWSEGKFLASHMPHVIDWLENNRSENFFLFFHFYDVHDPYILRDEYENMYHDLRHFEKEIELWKSVLDEKEVTIKNLLQLSNPELVHLMIGTWIDRSMSNLKRTMYKLKNGRDKAVARSFRKKWNSLIRDWKKQPDYLKQLQFLIDSYDVGIKYSDNILSELFSFLRSNEMWDNTIIIITSDHGEEFMEHDMLGHGRRLYDTLLHVPLIIKMPTSFKTVPKRISGLREIIDIMPTLLDACDIKFKKQMQGKSLLSLMRNQAEEAEGMVFASFRNIKMIRSPQWKYVNNDNSSQVDEFFNIGKDKLEQFNLIKEKNSNFDHMQSLLKAHIKNCISLYSDKYSKNRKSRKNIPQGDLKKQLEVLKALGYVN